jgi:NADH-ubiquinone oxidoreductase chain 5
VLYNKYIISPALSLGLSTSKVLDRGVIELLGPHGLSQSLYTSSRQLASIDTGVISTYGLFIFIGAISVTLLLFAPFLPELSGLQTDGSMMAYFGDIRVVLLYGAAFFYLGHKSLTSQPNA